jgi:ABC-2 type transport system permease protein
MSRARAIYLVARRELLERGRSRAFAVSVIVSVGVLLAGIYLPTLLGGVNQGDRLGIVGEPPPEFTVAVQAAASQTRTKIDIEPVSDQSTGERRLREGSLDALFVVPVNDERPTYIVKQRRNEILAQVVAGAWSAVRLQRMLTDAGISQTELAIATAPPTLRELEPSDPNRDTAFLFANVGVVLLFISIFTFGTWVLTGVVEEKQSRVVEVVLATLEPRDLLIGKVLGIGLLGLAQLVVMVSVGLGAGTASGRITLPPTTANAVAMLLLWFVLGYALYSTALGVLGALASRMEEASNASSPVSFIATGAYLFSLFVVIDDPAGLPARVATLIPPVAPMVVPLRAALGAIEPWEVALSALLTTLTIAVLFVIGGRVYAGAVLRTGARVPYREALRSLRG